MTFEEWSKNEGARKKTLLFGVAVLSIVGLLFHPSCKGAHASAEKKPDATVSKPSPVQAAPAPPVAPVVVAAPVPPAVTVDTALAGVPSILGKWAGGGVIPERNGTCGLGAEIRENPLHDPAHPYRAFTTLGCPVFLPLWLASHPGQKINPMDTFMKAASVTESVLEGSVEGEELVFSKVVDTASVDSQGCALESFRLRAFGNDAVLVHFKEGACQGGEMQMHKVGP